MKYLVLAGLILTGCDLDLARYNEVTQTGNIVCAGAEEPMRFVGPVYFVGPWVEFVTEDGSVIKTSFPCAVMWD